MRYLWLCFIVFTVIINASTGLAKGNGVGGSRTEFSTFVHKPKSKSSLRKDTTVKDTLLKENANAVKKKTVYNSLTDSVTKKPTDLYLFPAVSLQQLIKGSYAGLYVQEPSGEPGSVQNMFIRGAPMPLLSKKDVYQSQPLVILDGVPLIGEHPFAFDIQQYDYNRIGTATNPLANIDMDNIGSIQVLKDVAATAIYGPRAVNGAIILTSRTPDVARSITFNTYIGMVQRPNVTTINGKYENAFRQRFYDLYTTNGRYSDDENYPIYLSDSLNTVYSGKSDWTDLYYRNAMIYGINFGITGGSDRANFRFSLGNMKNQGVADNTGLDRYSAMFGINMKPLKWLLFSAMVNANRIERDRNRNLRDRFAQINYFPDLSAPLAPNKDYYINYLDQFKKGFDDNKSNIIEGYARIGIELGNFNYSSTFSVDYNEGYRDIFYARTLLQGNSYASNYYGFNQRLNFENKATYDLTLNNIHEFHFTVGQSLQWDTYKYSNAYAYKGANDYIKINLLQSDPLRNDYLTPVAFPRELTYRFLDKTGDNLVSFYGKADYTFNNKYSFTGTLRADGSSNAQPTDRWFYSPTVGFGWSVKNEFLKKNETVTDLVFRISAGRIGRLNVYDNYAQGPQYTASVGYTGNLTVPGYNAFGVLTRPYTAGWIGYGIPWAYSNQLNIGFDGGLFNNRLQFSVDLYSKTDKDQLLAIPSFAEYGYKQSIESGMAVNNRGIDVTIKAEILKKKDFSWSSAINLNHNSNKLKALPRGLDEIIIGNRFFKVGQPVDQYWLLTNDGIYNANSEIPVVNGQPLKYNGTALQAGDPRWRDLNGDNVIDNNDKSLQGHSLPTLSGGLDNNFKYKQWSLNTNLYFNLGRKLINQEMANRFDFINREGNADVNSVKEITFWEKRGDYTKYPLYNPWSTVIPYRVDQDLFLENASFLKLRSVSLGYDLTEFLKKKKIGIKRLFIYGSANNVLTITPYTGQDPELVSYDGYDTGYGQPLPRTYTFGVKMEL
ncbi:SusC/RagA family TonB-linked outer membrane protein [Mucilaginibacter gynuensis]|uniref:SusC/RagA family TonB-linked outer membrane protein n=1 Tax=Mucilaginibacter gynuensis TaxID=1302236 RepID=A0ABP8FLW4_9SPHI